MKLTSWLRVWLVAVALVAGLAGCDSNNQKKLSIVAEPADATVIVGATATFAVQSNSSKATYQWRRNGTAIPSATGASYTTAATVAGDSGAKFSVVVTRGQKTVTSREATLTVNVPTLITTQPAAATAPVGATATFSVVAAGPAPLTYQWRKNATEIAGATAATYTTPALVVGDNGAAYSVVVTSPAGTVTSANATLTVQEPTSITTQPVPVTALVGATATFSVVAAGTAPLTYQWSRSGVAITGATAATYTTPALVIGDSGAAFSVVVSGAAGAVTSTNAMLTVQAPSVVAWDPTLLVADGNFDMPVAGMDDLGRGHAVWLDNNSRLLAKTGSISGAWGASAFVDVGPEMVGNQGAFAPQLAVNPAGKGVLAWGFFTSGFASHVAVSLGDAGTWGAPKKIASGFNGDAPSAAIDDAGRAVVTWQSSGVNQRIMAAVANGTTWSTPVSIARDPAVGWQPKVAVAANGKGLIVYSETTGFVAIPVDLTLPQPFGTPVQIYASTEFADYRLAVDQQGGAVLLFYEYVNNNWATRVINLRPGSGWSAAVTLAADVQFFLREIDVASDEQGNAIAAWGEQVQTVPGGEFMNTVRTSSYTAAGGWSPAQLRPSIDADGVEGVQLAASRTGRIVLSWVQEQPPLFVSQVWAQVFEGGRWQAAAPVQSSTNYGWVGDTQPFLTRSLAVAPNGDGLLLWLEEDESNSARIPVMGAYLPK